MRWLLSVLLVLTGSVSADELPTLESVLNELVGTEVQVEGHLISSHGGASSLRTKHGLLNVTFALPRDLYKEVIDCGINKQDRSDFCRIKASAEISKANVSIDLLVYDAVILNK